MQEDIWAKMNGTLHRIAVLLLFFRANASSWSDGIKSEQKKTAVWDEGHERTRLL